MIRTVGLKKQFGDNLIWQNVNLEIDRGDCVAIIGPSGCGKSTLLRCLNLLETPTAGQVFIDEDELTAKDADVDRIRRRMGMVYQSFNLFSHKTVLENVIMGPMLIHKTPKAQAIREAMEVLALVGMTERADFMPSQLSGGQKQRAAIARCLAMKPELILFDEPTSALDPTMVDEVLAVINRLVKDGMTCVIVTHEMSFARNVATTVLYMDDRGIYEMGPPEQIFEHPRREKTRAFIYHIKTFQYHIGHHRFDQYELMTKVSEFGHRQLLSQTQIYRLQLLIEESVINLLLPSLPDDGVDVNIRIGYQEKEDKVELSLDYGGPEHRPDDSDELAMAILRGMSQSLEYSYAENRNRLEFKL